jgi:three-Cys-motif partner protein
MGRRQDLQRLTVYPSDPHTRIKHSIYRGYIDCWMPKILQATWHNGATVIDAFSGAGHYSDKLDGSPLVIAKAYAAHHARPRFKPLHLVTLEERPDRTAEAQRVLSALPAAPGFTFEVRPPGRFAEHQQGLLAAAVARKSPVLWILDPHGLTSVPFDAVAACVRRSGHEAIVSLMLDEMHRFKDRARWDQTMNAVFGDDSWKAAGAVGAGDEARAKDAFVRAYQDRFEQAGCVTARFDVRVSNRTPRYALVLISRHQASLQCWNPVAWNMDPNRGVGAAVQGELGFGPDLTPLRERLTGLAGKELSWAELERRALTSGFTAAHLRRTLSDLALAGTAVRTAPAASSSPWPETSTIRFFADETEDDDDAEPT